MKSPSSQLISQLVPKRDVASFLIHWCDRPGWEQKYNTNDLEIEFWANGLWIKQAGIVAYSTLANFVIYSSNLKGSGLEVKQESKSIYLVQGSTRSTASPVASSNANVCFIATGQIVGHVRSQHFLRQQVSKYSVTIQQRWNR
jgi:hypothetical protein